jgi:hypothetical protein
MSLPITIVVLAVGILALVASVIMAVNCGSDAGRPDRRTVWIIVACTTIAAVIFSFLPTSRNWLDILLGLVVIVGAPLLLFGVGRMFRDP